MKRRLWRLLIIALLLLLLVPANLTVESASRIDVLVTYHQPLGPSSTESIDNLGGTVKTVYHIVPTVLASMPVANVDALKADPGIKVVEF